MSARREKAECTSSRCGLPSLSSLAASSPTLLPPRTAARTDSRVAPLDSLSPAQLCLSRCLGGRRTKSARSQPNTRPNPLQEETFHLPPLRSACRHQRRETVIFSTTESSPLPPSRPRSDLRRAREGAGLAGRRVGSEGRRPPPLVERGSPREGQRSRPHRPKGQEEDPGATPVRRR